MLWEKGQSDFCEPLRFLIDFGIAEHSLQYGDAEPIPSISWFESLGLFFLQDQPQIVLKNNGLEKKYNLFLLTFYFFIWNCQSLISLIDE